jgi:hypothetical protein
MSVLRIIGIVLLVLGVVALVFGAYNLITFHTSAGGKFTRAFGVSGKTKIVQQSFIEIAIGAVCIGVGFFLYKRR